MSPGGFPAASEGVDDGCMWGDSRDRCMGLEGGPKFRGGAGPVMPGIMGLDSGLFGPGVCGGLRKGGRICCIIWCSMNRGRGTGPRGVITIGGLPGGTPRDGWRPGTGGGGGGGTEGLSWGGRGVGFFAEDEDEEDEDDAEEHTALCSDGEPDVEMDGPAVDTAPPGDGALRRNSLRGVLQDSGVRSCTPVGPSLLPSTAVRGGLHRAPGRAAWVSL